MNFTPYITWLAFKQAEGTLNDIIIALKAHKSIKERIFDKNEY